MKRCSRCMGEIGDDLVCPATANAATTEAASSVTYTYEESDTGIRITGYEGTLPANMVLPKEIHGKPVTGIGENAFWGCTGLASATIPDSVTEIGWHAFIGTGLTEVSLSSDCRFFVMTIGRQLPQRYFPKTARSLTAPPDRTAEERPDTCLCGKRGNQ